MRTAFVVVLLALSCADARSDEVPGYPPGPTWPPAMSAPPATAASTQPRTAPSALFPHGMPMPPSPPPRSTDDGHVMSLPVMSVKQVRELVSDLVAQLQTTTRYRPAPEADAKMKGAPLYPPNVVPVVVLTRDSTEYLRIGFVMLPRRLPQLWVQGLALRGNAAVPSDVDVPGVLGAARTVLTESAQIMGRLRISDLEARTVLLSYADADAALFVLRARGYSAITDTESVPRDDWFKGNDVDAGMATAARVAAPAQPAPSPTSAFSTSSFSSFGSTQSTAPSGPRFPAIKNLPTTINLDRLPIIVRVPSTDARNLGLVGAEPPQAASAFSSFSTREPTSPSYIPTTAAPLTETVATGTQELLVLYHPDYPEQFQKVSRLIEESIDRPARQVYIEVLVVEVNRTNLDKLGVQWAFQKGQSSLFLGSVAPPGQISSALSFFRNSLNSDGNIQLANNGNLVFARIEALVSENKAEVLSRPSVVTLDNRQATIRVGLDLPVASSVAGDRTLGYNFRAIPTGIMLNVRPRVSQDGHEISMLIDAAVSDHSPANDLKVIDPDTHSIVVQAPAVQMRRVQTYARIRDNTPLIIGGLMTRSTSRGSDRVPLLARIPVIGSLFGSTQIENDQLEVIIILTPSVVDEAVREAKAQYPKDDPRFDVTGTALFKEKVRIGAEDVVDSAQFRTNERLLRYRDVVGNVIDRHPELAAREPFAQFTDTRVPGEDIFVRGMMYRMLDRLNAGDAIPAPNLRVLKKDGEWPRPVALDAVLANYGNGRDPASFFQRNPGKALALIYRMPTASSGVRDMLLDTTPESRVVECADRDAWRSRLWELNQPDEAGPRRAILLQQPGDLRRLQLAVAVQNTIVVNGGPTSLHLDGWVAGRMLNMQEVAPQWERTVDADIARNFFVGEHYYAAFMQHYLAAMESLDQALHSGALEAEAGMAATPR
jgi:general secretion pathway protein D